MGEAQTLLVDFNRLDDDDVLWAPKAALPSARPGQAVVLLDREGNRCLGYVLSITGKRVTARAELSTWIDADAVEIVAESNDLDQVLADRARLVVRTSAPTAPTLSD